MSESYILHDVMRKVKADGLFDSIRRDLITDIEQKPSYLDVKSQIEAVMASYLSEHKWNSSLKKSDIRERARRHIETSNLIKETLPSFVNQYMQTCQEQLIQPRLQSFVSDHIEHVYSSVGGTHVYRPQTSYTQSTPTSQEPVKTENKPTPIKNEPISSKPSVSNNNKNPQITNVIKKPIPPTTAQKKPAPIVKDPIKKEKKTRLLSPTHSPNELINISPSSVSIENERTTISSSPSPPPPVVRIASPLSNPSTTETSRKTKRLPENKNDDNSTITTKKKKIKTDDNQQKNISDEKSENVTPVATASETDTRKLRPRRPNPKYSNEQFETEDLSILEPSSSSSPPSSSSIPTKTKKFRQLKSSTSFEQENFDTPSSPPPSSTSVPIETFLAVGEMSPEYGTSLPSSAIAIEQADVNDDQPRTPSPLTTNAKKTTSPRRLRPRRANERSSTMENQNEKIADLSPRTSSKTRDSSRHRTEPTNASSTSDDTDVQPVTMKKTRHPSSSSGENNSSDMPARSVSVPDNLNTSTDETSTTPTTAPVSKSFIWKPKISK